MIALSKIPLIKRLLKTCDLVDVEIDGLDVQDYPKFCDAYIASASLKVGPLLLALGTADLGYLTDNNPDYVNELSFDQCVEY